MSVKSKADYYKSLRKKYNGLVYPFQFKSGRFEPVNTDLGGHDNDNYLTMMNLPMMGSGPQVNVASDGSTVEVNGFAMESSVTPSATVMEIIDPMSNQPQPIYGVEAYVGMTGLLLVTILI